jgi:hypothetical protein
MTKMKTEIGADISELKNALAEARKELKEVSQVVNDMIQFWTPDILKVREENALYRRVIDDIMVTLVNKTVYPIIKRDSDDNCIDEIFHQLRQIFPSKTQAPENIQK